MTSADAPIGGLTGNKVYYVVVVDANHIRLALDAADAFDAPHHVHGAGERQRQQRLGGTEHRRNRIGGAIVVDGSRLGVARRRPVETHRVARLQRDGFGRCPARPPARRRESRGRGEEWDNPEKIRMALRPSNRRSRATTD